MKIGKIMEYAKQSEAKNLENYIHLVPKVQKS